jgi:DNA-binding transcriptional regulator YhcF (GntR family)
MLKSNVGGANIATPGAARPLPRKSPVPSPTRPAPPMTRGATAIALVRSSSLPALVQQELERMILAASFPAGSKLNEAAIAERLGVSRGPVREAFRALEESGLVRLEKNRGVFVRQIPVEEADEIYELRAVLDEFVGRRLAQSASPEQVKGAFRPASTGWSARPPRATSRRISIPTLRSTTAWSSLRATRSSSASTGASSTSCIFSGTQRSPKAACFRFRRASIARSSNASPRDAPPPPAARSTGM